MLPMIRRLVEDYNQGMARPDPEALADLAKATGRTPEQVAAWFTPEDDDKVINVADVAERLDVSEKVVYQLFRSGELPGRKVGRKWRTTVRALSDWLEHKAAD